MLWEATVTGVFAPQEVEGEVEDCVGAWEGVWGSLRAGLDGAELGGGSYLSLRYFFLVFCSCIGW